MEGLMEKKDYNQNYFKMHCCFCDQKILVEDKKPGDKFNCPACKESITTPDYVKESVKVQKVDKTAESKDVKPEITKTKDNESIEQKVEKAETKTEDPKENESRKKAIKVSSKKVRAKIAAAPSLFTPVAIVMLALVIGTFYFFGNELLSTNQTPVETVSNVQKVVAKPKKVTNASEPVIQVELKQEVPQEDIPIYKQPLDLVTGSAKSTGSIITKDEVNLLVTKLKNHCYECHGNQKHEEDLNFEEMLTREDFFKNYVHFKNSLDYISAKEMPPVDAGELETEEIEEFTALIEKLLYTVEASSDGKTGPVKLRRLNAKEYDKTVSAVTGVEFNLSQTYNINNLDDASVLSIEGFIEAAQEISMHAGFDVNKGFVFSQELPEYKKITQAEEREQLDTAKRDILKQFYFSEFSYTEAIARTMKALFELKQTKGTTQEKFDSIAQNHGIYSHFLAKANKCFNTPARSSQDRTALQKWQGLNIRKDKDPQKAIDHFLKNYEDAKNKNLEEGSLKARVNNEFIERVESLFKFSVAKLQLLLAEQTLKNYLAHHSLQDVLKQGRKSKFLSQFHKSHSANFAAFLTKLYRKPVSEKEVSEFTLRFADLMQEFGLDAATRIIMTQSFISLKFLYIYEDKKTENSKLDSYELASRISYGILHLMKSYCL